ncbi:MAG: hypothetical protein SPK32_08030, partial [Bacteroidaceae bacterium]|nr:hypothetical protein [Bacteroidaceae bacterium]
DNTSSHLASATVQGAIDELQGSKIDKTSILQELGNAEDKVMSQKAVSDKMSEMDCKVDELDKRTKVNQKEMTLSYTLYEHNGSVNCHVITPSGAFDDASLMNVAVIDVSSIRGKKISINSAISANPVIGYKWVKTDGTETVLSASEESKGDLTPVTVDLLVPADANTLYFSFYFSLPFSATVLGGGENIDVAFENLSSSVDKNKQQIELIKDKIGNEDIDAGDNDNITKAINAAFKASNIVDTKRTEIEIVGTITSGWVNGTTGEIEYDTALWNILTIDVSEYNGCTIKMEPEDTHPVIGWKIVDASDNILSNGLCGIFEINIPNSANKLIYSTRKAQGYNGGTVIKNEKVTKTAITIANDALVKAEKALDKISSTIIENGSVSTFADSLSNSKIEITDCPKYIKKRCSVTLDADISTIGEIKFGVGYDTARGCEVSITSNAIVVKNKAIGNIINEALSFNIDAFVRATFIHDYDKIKVIVCTKTNTFIKEITSTSKYVKEIYGYPFVYATNDSSLSKVRLRYTSKEFGFDTWVFGDSYTSISDDRWTMKVIEDYGYNNWMLCGLAGGESFELYNNLVSALKFGTPKYIVWMLGMNDNDSNGIANESWVSCFNNIKEICKKRNITLILNTVPNVATNDNTPKNTIIKNSGYRYIDSARSVGGDVFTQDVNNWYDGFLEDKSPYIHTSPLGASAQASQVIADFPEIMQ